MIKINDKGNCTGCHACSSICPGKCIQMAEDEQGFLYPQVDEARCVDCGLCEKACHMLADNTLPTPKTAFAAKNKNEKERLDSSSGGIFIAIAKWIIINDGVVYGAAFTPDFEVEHLRVTELSGLYKLQTSKYVQSRIGDAYSNVKNDLEAGRYVLFTGTPCQIGGLRSFLGSDYEKLYCQDIMCHGVPSPKLWRKYLKEQKGNVKEVLFRDKSKGWSHYRVVIKTDRTVISDEFNKNTYMRAFIADASLRPSCYSCHYKNLQYAGDYVLGDFWGVADHCPEMNDDKGVSLVLITTEKGKTILDTVIDDIEIREVVLEDALLKNAAAVSGARMNEKNVLLFDNIDKKTVHQIVEKYIRGSFFHRVMNKLER